MNVRPYQQKAIRDVLSFWQGGGESVMVQMPTGAGKGHVAGELLKICSSQVKSSLFIVHKKTLIDQFSQRFRTTHGLSPAIWSNANRGIMVRRWIANERRLRRGAVVLGTPQALTRTGAFPSVDKGGFEYVFWDEAHHIGAETWQLILDRLRKDTQLKVVGFSATPMRGNGEGLSKWFQKLICPTTPEELILDGHLVPVKAFVPEKKKAIELRVAAGAKRLAFDDFSSTEISAGLKKVKIWGDLAKNYKKIATNHDGTYKRGAVFCASIPDAERAVDLYNHSGINAVCLHSRMEEHEKENALDDFRDGKVDLLVSVEMVTEGFDLPELEVVVFLAPTRSLIKFMQCAGRMMRPAAGKQNGFIIDHVGNVLQHGMPDEHRNWSLDMEKVRGDRGTNQEITTFACDECGFMNRKGVLKCGNCGVMFPKKGGDGGDGDDDLLFDDDSELVEVEDKEERKRKFAFYNVINEELINMRLEEQEENPNMADDHFPYKKLTIYQTEYLREAMREDWDWRAEFYRIMTREKVPAKYQPKVGGLRMAVICEAMKNNLKEWSEKFVTKDEVEEQISTT
jgi:superfamily II DNA or RNA helicase